MDDFRDAPISLNEHRANKGRGGAEKWTVREMLVAVLRDIDAGKLNPTWAGLALQTDHEDGTTSTDYFQRCSSAMQLVGIHFKAAQEHLS